ncbi:MAG: hypothetical protein V3T76_08140, partial [candidate division NC10 bacterium]
MADPYVSLSAALRRPSKHSRQGASLQFELIALRHQLLVQKHKRTTQSRLTRIDLLTTADSNYNAPLASSMRGAPVLRTGANFLAREC